MYCDVVNIFSVSSVRMIAGIFLCYLCRTRATIEENTIRAIAQIVIFNTLQLFSLKLCKVFLYKDFSNFLFHNSDFNVKHSRVGQTNAQTPNRCAEEYADTNSRSIRHSAERGAS